MELLLIVFATMVLHIYAEYEPGRSLSVSLLDLEMHKQYKTNNVLPDRFLSSKSKLCMYDLV